MSEIVIDPEVPVTARRELRQTPLSALAGFNDPPARPRTPNPPGRGIAACGALAVAAVLLCAGLPAAGPFSADLVFLAVLLVLPVAVVGTACLVQKVAGGPSAATLYRRRYVVPVLDLHGDELTRWRRAAKAASTIEASEAVRLGLVDSTEIAAALPYHLWDIAERLALLSGPERRQAQIMRDLDASDPDVRLVLEPQLRVQERTVADIERRIARLEGFARLAQRADSDRARRRAVDELAKLNPDYEELVVRLDDPDCDGPDDGHSDRDDADGDHPGSAEPGE